MIHRPNKEAFEKVLVSLFAQLTDARMCVRVCVHNHPIANIFSYINKQENSSIEIFDSIGNQHSFVCVSVSCFRVTGSYTDLQELLLCRTTITLKQF